MKKHNTSKKTLSSRNNYDLYIFIALLSLIFSFYLVTYARANTNEKITKSDILEEESFNKENKSKEQSGTKEKVENIKEPEPTEAPEPIESLEPKESEKQETEKIHQEIKQEVERGQIESIEIVPGKGKRQTGALKLEQTNGQTTEKQIPSSQTPVATLQSAQVGSVSLSVNSNGTISLVNRGMRIETNYPVILDPQTKTLAIRTSVGVTVINMFPSQILPQLSMEDKPAIIRSVHLTNENNQPTYLISGKQTRRFMGIFPVETVIKTRVRAKDGYVLSVDEPWYFRYLSFLYSI